MMRRGRNRALLACLLLTLLVGVGPSRVSAAPPSPDPKPSGNSARPFWLKAGETSEPASSGVSRALADLPEVTAQQAFSRASTWLTAHNGGPVPYSQNVCFPGFTAKPCVPPKYRTDCSGFVSMAFGLDRSYVTGDMVQSWFSTPITKAQLQPGDLMLNATPGDGHVALFERWTDSTQTRYWAYEQSGDGGTHHRTIPYPYFGSYSMAPYRYVGMTGPGGGSSAEPDFDGDGRSDAALYRPSGSTWHVWYTGGSPVTLLTGWGTSGDILIPADYNGDGRTDAAVYRPSTANWHVWYTGGSPVTLLTGWGTSGDIPVPGDYNGDGKADAAIFRPSAGSWHVWYTGGSPVTLHTGWGTSGDIPIVGDYNGDGRTDTALYRPGGGSWHVWYTGGSPVTLHTGWGTSGDFLIPADYNGDGRTDAAVFRPSAGSWHVWYAGGSPVTLHTGWGTSGDIPIVGDYNGDGRTDAAVFRPSTGGWHVWYTAGGTTTLLTGWGGPGDVPLAAQDSMIP